MAQKILIIEDEPALAELNQLILNRSGYEAFICETGRDAVAMVQDIKPDLIILDVMLPGMDGSAIAKELSSDMNTASIPIIVSSALEESRALFENVPQVKTFVFKPVSPKMLVDKVTEILGPAK